MSEKFVHSQDQVKEKGREKGQKNDQGKTSYTYTQDLAWDWSKCGDYGIQIGLILDKHRLLLDK